MLPTQPTVPRPARIADRIEAARPGRCLSCHAPARRAARIVLRGHGIRWREVGFPTEDGLVVRTVGIRRFRCCDCGRTCSVRPPEVLPRCAYSLPAIVMAWFLAAATPVGDDLPEREVHGQLGLFTLEADPEPARAGPRRWRSLSRWAGLLDRWWPSRPVPAGTWRERVAGVLAGFLPGEDGRKGAIRRALSAHAAGGCPV